MKINRNQLQFEPRFTRLLAEVHKSANHQTWIMTSLGPTQWRRLLHRSCFATLPQLSHIGH
jgi:hypothetical protein